MGTRNGATICLPSGYDSKMQRRGQHRQARACIIRNFRNVLNGSNFPPPPSRSGQPFRDHLLRHFLCDENRGGEIYIIGGNRFNGIFFLSMKRNEEY